MPDGPQDLYQRLEIEVRTPKRRLALDAFLPDPATLPSAVAAPAPPPLPEMGPEEAHFFRRHEADGDPEPEPKPRRKAKSAAAPKNKKESPKSLQEEIEEFMSRDRRAYAPDDDLESSAGRAPGQPTSGAGEPGPGDPGDGEPGKGDPR